MVENSDKKNHGSGSCTKIERFVASETSHSAK